jgi:catechol 2,3-dioxygenase-like lactoylglutathione lyase family enzyme
MLGRFLELSLTSPRILDSWQWYQRLGFLAATDGGVWGHPYAVVTDGRIALGLHDAPVAGPWLTYVQPDLARHVEGLLARGVEFERCALGEHTFNEVLFATPEGHGIRLLEARTYSMPAERAVTPLGWFEEIALPVRDLEAARAYWEDMGFVAVSEAREPWLHVSLTSDTLNIGLHVTRALDGPTLVFSSDDRAALDARLAAAGVVPERRLPGALDPAEHLLLRAPEGTPLWIVPPPPDA